MSGLLIDPFKFGFTPASLSPYAWYDATQESSYSDGGAVGQMTDFSGNGRHAVQGTAGNKPAYRASGINAKASFDFDGSDDYLDWTSGGAGTDDLAQPYTVVAVAIRDSDSGSGRAIITSRTTTTPTMRIDDAQNFIISAGTSLQDAGPFNDGTARLLFAEFDGAGSQLRVNGALVASGDAGANALLDGWRIGRDGGTTTRPWDGDIGELLIFNAALAAADITALESYLMTKWGL